MSAPRFLTDPDLRLILFGGKGGVGKTTCAVAAGLSRARRFPDTALLLLSTDPAHSLKDSLGGLTLPAGIEVVEFDAQAALEDFRRLHGGELQAIAERGTFLDDEDIGRFLSLSLPGMDELLGFLDIARRAESGDGRCIVVDTAPSGHTLRLLAMPELLRGWVETLDSLLAKHRYMKQLFAGAFRPDELDRFLDELSASIDVAARLLADPRRCRFVPVMNAETLSVRETMTLIGELTRLQLPWDEVVVNLLAPASECPTCSGMRGQQLEALRQLPAQLQGRTLWGTALRAREVRGPALDSFFEGATLLDPRAWPAAPRPSAPASSLLVEDPAPPPASTARLLLFAGKGGVGKTTLACATALRLVRSAPWRRVLLFSTDPAHSLGDCLDQAVGPRPAPVERGLMAQEVDAPAQLEALKEQYRRELDELFGALLGGLDLPFDREVMERIIDLSPPGLDEIMALTGAMESLASGSCDLLVLDSAPTGHLVRLLEMPQLIDDWLKAFFELFLKYRRVFGMPRLAERLVALSKDLHRFQAMLRDPARAALYAVSIPTRMALEETRDLFAACGRIGVDVPVLFLNLMTPESACDFCARRARQERELEQGFARSLPVRRVRVLRQPEPRGVERLAALGDALYQDEVVRGGYSDARPTP